MQLDLSFTADWVPVLMHDETLERTTNGSGPVNKITFAQLRRLDAGLRHRMRWASAEVPGVVVTDVTSLSSAETSTEERRFPPCGRPWRSASDTS